LAGVAGFGKLHLLPVKSRFRLAGIRTAANANTNTKIDAGANRLGASAGVAIVHELGAPEFTPKANP